MTAQPEIAPALDHVVVDRYTDIVGPSNEMLGPVRDGGRIEFLTVPGCWGPMITPSIRSGHEVTLPVRVEGAAVGDAVALHVERLEQTSAATTSGTHEGWDGRFISDPFVANICPTCREEDRHFLYPDTYLDGVGHQAVRCSTCGSEVIPFRMVEGYTMVFDGGRQIGVTVTPERARELAKDARAWVGLTEQSTQHPIVALATADLVGVMTRCRISAGNLGSIPAVDLPSSHNCGDFGAFLVGAEHEFAVTEEQLEARTDVHMDIDSVRAGSTLIVPVKVDGGGIYAGDVHAMIGDGEIAVINKDAVSVTDFEGNSVQPSIQRITWDPIMAEKGGFKHFMLKEIYEQPTAARDTILGRVSLDRGRIFLEDLNISDETFRSLEKVTVIACGTSWHAGHEFQLIPKLGSPAALGLPDLTSEGFGITPPRVSSILIFVSSGEIHSCFSSRDILLSITSVLTLKREAGKSCIS